jgi:tetratricopeptide (TPR) repeat protein
MTFDGAGDYKAAEQSFLQAERAGATHPLALVGKSFRLAQARHLKEARQAADEALRLGPHLWETHFASGYVLEEQTNMGLVPPEPSRAQAIVHLRKALELSPRQAEVWTWLAHVLARTPSPANRTEALRIFNHAVALEPQNGNRYVVRCLIRKSLGDATGAQADLQKARDLGAARALLLHADAVLATSRGDNETAFRLLGQLIQEKQDWPGHVGNWLVLGFQLRRDQEVRGRFEEWCRANPEYPEVFALRAQLKARDADFTGAVTEDRAGLKLAPYNHKLSMQLALHLSLLRNWREALTAADAVLEVSPRDFAAQSVRVRCLAELGQGAEAKTLLDSLPADYPARAKEIDELRRSLAGKLPN